jgi:hypothetical protein
VPIATVRLLVAVCSTQEPGRGRSWEGWPTAERSEMTEFVTVVRRRCRHDL